MKYKNIVFDFGNVIGRFDGKAILSEFSPYEEQLHYLSENVYKRGTASACLQKNGHAALLYFRIPLHLSMN